MSVLTTAEDDDLNAEWIADLPDTCVVRATVEAVATDVLHAQTWPTVTATVPCAVLDRGSAPNQDGNIDDTLNEFARTVVMGSTTTVRTGDRIGWDAITLAVVAVHQPGTRSPRLTLDCIEVTP